MLDAYIIERIRRDQDRSRHRNSQRPLHIEQPRERSEHDRRDREPEQPTSDRGSVVVDFHL